MAKKEDSAETKEEKAKAADLAGLKFKNEKRAKAGLPAIDPETRVPVSG